MAANLHLRVHSKVKAGGAVRIGELAKRSDVSVHALRFYEQAGILKPSRKANGYRDYGPGAVEMVRAVRFARGVGFTLREVATVLAEVGGVRVGRERKLRLLKAKREQLFRRRVELTAVLRIVEQKIAALE